MDEQLSKLPSDDSHFGLIHFDFELDNVLWTDKGLGIIDFDDYARYWFAADLAFALRDLFGDEADAEDWNSDSLENLVRGYRRVRALDEEGLGRLPLFLRRHNLMSFAKLGQVLSDNAPSTAPQWMENLRNKLAAKRGRYRIGFPVDAGSALPL